jgi:hypothetical protein
MPSCRCSGGCAVVSAIGAEPRRANPTNRGCETPCSPRRKCRHDDTSSVANDTEPKAGHDDDDDDEVVTGTE